MNDAKYMGMDVHQATIVVAIRDSRGNLVIKGPHYRVNDVAFPVPKTHSEEILQLLRYGCGCLSPVANHIVKFRESTQKH
jgi:hypothetical protein